MAYIPSSAQEAQFLKDYDSGKYRNPAVAADAALFAVDGDALKILLIRRGGYPYKNCWALPGGFVDIHEDILDSVHRELREETGLSGIYLEQVYCWGRPERDPRQRVITVSFAGIADAAQLSPKAGDDASETAWFTFSGYTAENEDGYTAVSYTLSGPGTLHPLVRYPAGRMQLIEAVETGGLAFDHAESIAYSYAYLMRRAREGFLDLAFADAALRERARRALGNA